MAVVFCWLAIASPGKAQVGGGGGGPAPASDCPGGGAVTGYPFYGAPLGAGGHCGTPVASGTINTSTVGSLSVYSGTGTVSGITPGGDVTFSSPNFTVTKLGGAALGTTTPTAGNLLIGDGSKWNSVSPSGDVAVTSAGIFTLNAGVVTAAKLATGAAQANITAGSITNAQLVNSTITLGSTTLTLGGAVTTVAGLTLTSPTLNSPTIASPTLSGTAAGSFAFSGTVTFNGSPIFAAQANAPLLGADATGTLRAISLGTGCSLTATTLTCGSGGGGGFTPPASGTLMVSNATTAPIGLAPPANGILASAAGAWAPLASGVNSTVCTNASGIVGFCSTAAMQTLLGYQTANQTITLSQDASGSGATAISVTNLRVNGVNYPATPAVNTVPTVTAVGQVGYLSAAQLAAVSGFGTMLTQNANAVNINGGTISGVSISGLSLSSLGNIPANTIVCNNTGSSAVPIACTTGQITTLLGFGTMASQAANNVAITGGTITGTTISGSSNTLSNIALSSLSTQAANTIVCNSTAGVAAPTACTAGQISTILSLGTIASQNANNVTITGGSLTGTTINGASNTLSNIGLGSLATEAANTVVCNPSVSAAAPVACTAGQISTILGLGTMAIQSAASVGITGGTIAGTTINGASNSLSNIALSSLSTQAANTIVCNNTAGTAAPIACTSGQISTLLGLGTMATQNANNVAITGGSVTGLPSPSAAADAATKGYVDAVSGGQAPHTPVAVATAAVLPNTPAYNNNTTGVGATLTSATNTALVIDGSTISTTTTRVLVSQQASGFQNGIYTLTQAGSGTVPWVLTRATDFDQAVSGEVATGATVLVTGGSTLQNTSWSLSNTGTITIGATALSFVQIGASTAYTADNTTLQLIGNQFSIKNNGVGNTQLAQMNANTVKANFTGALANAADFAMPGCADSGGNHLNYVAGTGITCGTSSSGGGSISGMTPGQIPIAASASTITSSQPTGTTGASVLLQTNASGQMVAPVATTTGNFSGQITSTLATGTAPFVVASSTNVPNLNASSLSGATFAAPGPIGSSTPSTGAFTNLSASGTVSGTGFSTYLATPPAIGGTTPAAGSFTALSVSGAVSGAGFTALFASPPSIGNTAANTGAFTNLSASGTISGTGFSTYLASPPAIGGTAAAAGSFTTLSASSTVSGAGFSTYLASPPAIGGTAPAAGSFTNLSASGSLSASGTVSGTGFTTYLASPPAIGGTAPAGGSFTTLSASGAVTGAGFSAYLASPPPIGGTAAAAGSFTTLSSSSTLSAAALSASGTVSGAGFTALFASPPAIGSTAAAAGNFTTLNISGAITATGITAGTQVSCLGLTSANVVASSTGGCGTGSGGGTTPTVNRITTGTTNTLASPTTFTTQIWASGTTGAKTQNIPACASGIAGTYLTVADEQGTAGLYPIDVHPASGSITGGADFFITANYSSMLFQCDSTGTIWQLIAQSSLAAATRSVSGTVDTISTTDNGNVVKYTNSGATTVTLPDVGSAGGFAAGLFQTVVFASGGGPVTINRQTSSTINGGTSLFLAPNQSVILNADNTGTNYTALIMGPRTRTAAAAWVAGMNISAAARGIPIETTSQAWTIAYVTCRPEDVVGGAATVDVYVAASGTALSSGTKVTSTSCNANTGAATNQTLSLSSTAVPAGSTIGILATGAGWAASTGNGGITIGLQ